MGFFIPFTIVLFGFIFFIFSLFVLSLFNNNPKINTGSFYTVGEKTVYQCFKYKSDIGNNSVNENCGDRICLNGVEYLVGDNYTLMYDKDKSPLQCVYTANTFDPTEKIHVGSFYTSNDITKVYSCYKSKDLLDDKTTRETCDSNMFCLNGITYLDGSKITLMYGIDEKPLQCSYRKVSDRFINK